MQTNEKINKAKPRVIVIGLDGATFTNLKPWMEEGLLPNLKFLVDNGASGELESTMPRLSSPAWTSFMTGVNPGKHGVFGFIKPFNEENYEKELYSSVDIKAKTIFETLSEQEKVSVAVNIPMTYPPFEINGFMIACGLTTPSTNFNFSYPETLFDKINIKKENYILNVRWQDYPEDKKEDFFSALIECTKKRKEAGFKLMDACDWDLSVVIFGGTDWIQHFCWHHLDPTHIKYNQKEAEKFKPLIIKHYQTLDSIIGEVLARLDDNTSLIIMSDHGFGPRERKISLHKLLEKENLLCYKDASSLEKINEQIDSIRGRLHKNSLIYRIAKKLIKLLNTRFGHLFAKNIRRKKIFGPERDYWEKINWGKTLFYAGLTNGAAFANLKTRNQKHGIINSNGDYQKAIDKLKSALDALYDPVYKQKVKVNIYKKENIYAGPFANDGYDLCLECEDGRYFIQHGAYSETIFSNDKNWTGSHTKNGVVICYGKNVKKAQNIKEAKIIDIAPTILHILEIEIPDYIDGKVLAIFDNSYIVKNPIKHQKLSGNDNAIREKRRVASAQDENEKVKQRLADLGYI